MHGRRSIEEKAQSQQYLSPPEDEAVVDFLLQMSHLGQPVRMKHISAKLTEAEQMYQRALAGYEKALGPDHCELKRIGIVTLLV